MDKKNEQVKNQHYIPRSYLKNFGYLVNSYTRPSGKVDEKWSIYNVENGGEIKTNSTKKICKEEYLYDLPLVDEEFRQSIEKAYDVQIDKHFGEVTRFLCNPRNKILTNEMREKVLKCFLSLHFRTPKFVKVNEDELLKNGYTLEQIKLLKTEKLEKHLEDFEKLFNSKLNCSLCINEAYGKYQYISGDNPVIFRHPTKDEIDVFSPENIVHIPISPKYCLTILPESETVDTPTFQRYYHPNHHVITINYDIERLHEKFIFGTKISLIDYLNESPFYKAPADNNHPLVLGLKNTLDGLNKCLDAMKKHGIKSFEHRVIFNYYWTNEQMFREDPNNIKMAKLLGLIK